MKIRVGKKLFSICVLLCLGAPAIGQQEISPKVLKDAYKDAFLVGAAVTPSITNGTDKASQDIVVKHFNSITVENVMKAALINPEPGVYNFEPADNYVAFGQ